MHFRYGNFQLDYFFCTRWLWTLIPANWSEWLPLWRERYSFLLDIATNMCAKFLHGPLNLLAPRFWVGNYAAYDWCLEKQEMWTNNVWPHEWKEFLANHTDKRWKTTELRFCHPVCLRIYSCSGVWRRLSDEPLELHAICCRIRIYILWSNLYYMHIP